MVGSGLLCGTVIFYFCGIKLIPSMYKNTSGGSGNKKMKTLQTRKPLGVREINIMLHLIFNLFFSGRINLVHIEKKQIYTAQGHTKH